MKASSPERGRASLCKGQPVQGVDFNGDTALSPDILQESIWDLPGNGGEIIAIAINQALDALEKRPA